MTNGIEKCPQCGGTLTVKQPSQVGGWLLIIIGIFLTPVCIGILLIFLGVSQLKSTSTPYWYCINCGYSRGKESAAAAGAALPVILENINFSGQPHFVLESGFRNNPAFKETPESIRASFEKAFEEYTKKNYTLATDALDKILFEDPSNKAALWGQLGLLFVKPLNEIPIEKPLKVLKEIGKTAERGEEKARLEKGVIKMLRTYYNFLFQRGALNQAILKRLSPYIDYLIEINPGDVAYRKYGVQLIGNAGFKGSDLWNKYHNYLLEHDEEYKNQYKEELRIAERNRKRNKIIIIVGAAIVLATITACILIYYLDIRKAEPVPPPKVTVIEKRPSTAEVIVDWGLPLRATPDASGKLITKLKKGEELKVLEKEPEWVWCRVETAAGEVGWVKTEVSAGPTLAFSEEGG